MPTSSSAFLHRCATVFLATAAVGLAMPQASSPAGDPRSSEQWAIAPDSVLNLPPAWQLSRGAGVVVAVVDSGAKLDHTDLAPNIWTNFDETPGNRVDDDRNGYVDDVHGVDFSTSASGNDLSDGWGHGTHVAGIIAAAQNGRGVVGVAPRARLMILKVLDAKGAGTTNGVSEAIRYAAANGARVINLSLSGPKDDPGLRSAVAAAAAANVLIVTSAGNDHVDVDRKPNYPASIAAPNLVAVAGTSPQVGRSLGDYSNFGKRTIALAAPGTEILSSTADGGWDMKSGTSMAAPMVSGVAALMAAVRSDLSAADLRAQLIQNASRASLPVGSGYVDALGAVSAVSGATSYDVGQRPALRVLRATGAKRGRTVTYTVQAGVSGATGAVASYRITAGRQRLGVLRPRGSPFGVRAKRRGRMVEARDGRGAQPRGQEAGDRVGARPQGREGQEPRGRRRRAPDLGERRRARGGASSRRPAHSRRGPPPTALSAAAKSRRRISLSGSNVALPLVADLAFYYRRAVRHPPRFTLTGGGSAAGLSDAARGIVDVGLTIRPPSPDDPGGLVRSRLAASGVCIVTNRANPIPSLNRAQIQDLVSGRVTVWEHVAGAPMTGPIAPAAPGPSTGQRSVFVSTFVDLETPLAYQPRTFSTPQQVRFYVLGTPGAWGYVDFAFTRGLHVVPYEGVSCSRASIAAGTYPGGSEIAFVTRGAPRSAAARFIRWARTSAVARKIVRTRYVPDADISSAAGQGLEPR